MQRSTFLPIHHAATLISSVDWGLDYRTPGEVFQEERVALLAAVETLPRVAEDSLNLASSLSK